MIVAAVPNSANPASIGFEPANKPAIIDRTPPSRHACATQPRILESAGLTVTRESTRFLEVSMGDPVLQLNCTPD